jgi:hypothetical protein
VRGLEALHAQGLLHRNVDTWAVLTSGGDDPDFRLTGFEWSMRVIGPGPINRPGRRVSELAEHSFRKDWVMFGLFASELLGVNTKRLLDLAIPPHEI